MLSRLKFFYTVFGHLADVYIKLIGATLLLQAKLCFFIIVVTHSS